MSVDRSYLLRKPAGQASRPSAARLFLDTRLVPLAANAAGVLEVALARASRRTGLRSSLILAGLIGAGTLALVGIVRRRPTGWRDRTA